jgi:lysophospholipase L1-like esterase
MQYKSKIFILLLSISLFWQCSQQKKINIFMIGDSTMAEYDSTRYPLSGWGMKLPLFFNENVTIHNFGKSGKSTKSFRDLGYWQKVQDSLKKGDYLIIQFGHNDEKAYDSSRYTLPGGTYNENLKRFVLEAKTKGAIPILATPIRRRKFNENGNLIDTHGEYPNAMRNVAKEGNIPLVDLTKMSKPLIESYGVEGSKKLFCWVNPGEYSGYPDGNEDNTHFSFLGATEVCKLFVKGIKDSDLELKEYLVTPHDIKN